MKRTAHARRRALLLKLRRGIRPYRRFDVRLSDDGRFELQTCRECGHVIRMNLDKIYPGTPRAFIEKLVRYRADGSGVRGECPRCTKAARDERYPLPPKVQP